MRQIKESKAEFKHTFFSHSRSSILTIRRMDYDAFTLLLLHYIRNGDKRASWIKPITGWPPKKTYHILYLSKNRRRSGSCNFTSLSYGRRSSSLTESISIPRNFVICFAGINFLKLIANPNLLRFAKRALWAALHSSTERPNTQKSSK